jgi:penicillin V acylase-like amidase (Ntn superfamily)
MCTSLSISDASGAIYIGRTLEYAGYDPWQLSYFPKGLKFTSAITATENGISYENTLAFIAITMDTSVGRFIKALYYSQFAKKAKNPDGAVYMISHVMNNFDRPVDVTMDPPDPSNPSTEGDGQSEFSVWIALSDLNRRKFFVRTYLELNYHQFDLNDFANVTTFQNIPFMARFIGIGESDSRSLAKS